MFDMKIRDLGEFDVAIFGGGISGVFAAVSAARAGAKVILIERSASLGGVLTEGLVPRMMDSNNKGGIVRELFSFLDSRGMSGARSGAKDPATGKLLPGDLVDVEACKYFFDVITKEAGVKVMLYSQIAALDMDGEKISSALIVSELANYSLSAKIYIDATGSGHAAAMAGCTWEFGEPNSGEPQPVSMGSNVVGVKPGFNGTNTHDEKSAYAEMLSEYGIKVSAAQVNVVTLPGCKTWTFSANFGYGVTPEDTELLSATTVEGRRELFETVEAHKAIPGYEDLMIVSTSSHIGIREGRRIFGEYRLTDDDILEGRRFDDGMCLVTLGVDVHKMNKDDTTETGRGRMTKPFHIPYRATVPLGVDNLLLSGRCISGDFYPHAAYRYMGDMASVGEAVGFAAAECVRMGKRPRELDGKTVFEFMKSRGYEM